jgi:hypothetical protein
MFSTTVTLFWKTELVLSNYMPMCSFFLLVRDFFWFYSLSLVMYSKFGVSWPLQAITALSSSGRRPCSLSGLPLLLVAMFSTQSLSNLLKWQAK